MVGVLLTMSIDLENYLCNKQTKKIQQKNQKPPHGRFDHVWNVHTDVRILVIFTIASPCCHLYRHYQK